MRNNTRNRSEVRRMGNGPGEGQKGMAKRGNGHHDCSIDEAMGRCRTHPCGRPSSAMQAQRQAARRATQLRYIELGGETPPPPTPPLPWPGIRVPDLGQGLLQSF